MPDSEKIEESEAPEAAAAATPPLENVPTEINPPADTVESEVPPENPTQAGEASTESPALDSSSAELPTDTLNTPTAVLSEETIPSTIVSTPQDQQTGMHDDSKAVFSSVEFHDFIAENVLSFLDIMDIENGGVRREAILARKLNEEGIRNHLDLAEAFLYLQTELAFATRAEALVEHSIIYTNKCAAMKQWLTM